MDAIHDNNCNQQYSNSSGRFVILYQNQPSFFGLRLSVCLCVCVFEVTCMHACVYLCVCVCVFEVRIYLCVCMRACMYACVCACVCVCVRVSVYACMHVCVRIPHRLLLPLRLQEGGDLHQPQLGGADGAALPGGLPVGLGGPCGLVACVAPEKDLASQTAESRTNTLRNSSWPVEGRLHNILQLSLTQAVRSDQKSHCLKLAQNARQA